MSVVSGWSEDFDIDDAELFAKVYENNTTWTKYDGSPGRRERRDEDSRLYWRCGPGMCMGRVNSVISPLEFFPRGP